MTPPTSDAYYNPLMNAIVFPAGILQPPAFDMNAVDAVNYGAIGVVIGHEISHGFDDEGAQFDYLGRLRNWWTEADLKDFQDAALASLISSIITSSRKISITTASWCSGKALAIWAERRSHFSHIEKSLEGKPRPADIDGFTPEQQFFIAWGQFRGDEIRPEAQRLMVQTDPHPIAKYRVIGPLSNLPEFQKAWSCKADAADGAAGRQALRRVVEHGEKSGCPTSRPFRPEVGHPVLNYSAGSSQFDDSLFVAALVSQQQAPAAFGGIVRAEHRGELSSRSHPSRWRKSRGSRRVRSPPCAVARPRESTCPIALSLRVPSSRPSQVRRDSARCAGSLLADPFRI